MALAAAVEDLQPLSSYILVKPSAAPSSTEDGIILPTASEEPHDGVVVAVGPGKRVERANLERLPLSVEVGQKVVYTKYGTSLQRIEVGGEAYVLLREEDLLLTYRGPTPAREDAKPLSSYLLVLPKAAPSETKGGILLPTTDKERSRETDEGQVLAVGPGNLVEAADGSVARRPVWAAAGQQVMYKAYGAEATSLSQGSDVEDVEFALVFDRDVLLSYQGDEATLETLRLPPGKVLLRLQQEEEEQGGFVLASQAASEEGKKVGEVVAASDGILTNDGQLVPLGVEVGDLVRFVYGYEVQLAVGGDDRAEYTVVDAEACLARWRRKGS